ncbi:MAG: HD domain-containing protein [Ktedonobacteraceae bacterium]|nr:HD domain-containing protein [Ktedonobacteraceae bacterium]
MNRETYHLAPEILSILQQAAEFFSVHSVHTYLVGGAVRDVLLNIPCTDWDIVTDGDPPQLARQLANILGGSYAHMNDKASRITLKRNQHEIILDVSPLRGTTIEEDLRLRDFTINAIAIPLSEFVRSLTAGAPLPLIDPLHGDADLDAHCLRAVDDATFQHDPLRMLRVVRFMQRYQFTIEAHTDMMLTRDASLLLQVAPERIHNEFYAILEPPGGTTRLRFLDAHGLFTILIPEFIPARGMRQPELHHWDVLEHSLETVGYLEYLATLLQQPPAQIEHSLPEPSDQGNLVAIQTLLREAEEQHIFSFEKLTSASMKLAALLHDVGKTVTYTLSEGGDIRFYGHPQAGIPLAQQILRRLNGSLSERRLAQQVAGHHMRPGQLSRDIVTPRAVRRYFVDLGPTGIYVALISLADHLAMRGPEPLTSSWERHLATVCHLLNAYIRERELILPPRLIQPDELIHRLNLTPGPIIGKLLEAIAEAQTEGKLHSKEEALWLAEEILQKPEMER